MSYNAGNGWGDANDTERLLNFSLSGLVIVTSGSYLNPSGYVNFNISGNYTCSNPAKGNRRYVLAGMSYPNNIGSNPRWDVSISGTVTHHVNGDWQNGYDNLYINW